MNGSATTLLSVIIPTRNRAQLVSSLLDTFAVQEPVPFRWEVIVVDNGSTDQTARVAKEKSSSLPVEIRYVYEPTPGLHNGRHRGALEARGRYLAYLDDDVLLTAAWIRGPEKLIAGQAEAVVGRILPKWESRPPAWLTILTREPGYLSLLDLGPRGMYIDPGFVYGDNFFISSQVVFELGGFHPDSMPPDQLRFRGDGESALMMRFREAGLRAWYDPVATAYHFIPRARMSLGYLCQRSYAQGISDSFAEIRAGRSGHRCLEAPATTQPGSTRRSPRYYVDRIRGMTLRQAFDKSGNRIMELVPLSQPNIQMRLRRAYWAGYKYHQEEVEKDPGLLEWVIREHYWPAAAESDHPVGRRTRHRLRTVGGGRQQALGENSVEDAW